jgi:hypothetical protein
MADKRRTVNAQIDEKAAMKLEIYSMLHAAREPR